MVRTKIRRQHRVDEGNHDLSAHHGGKAPIKIAKTRADLIGKNREKVVLHRVRVPINIQATFQKQASRCDDRDEAKEQECRGTAGDMSDVLKVTCFLLQTIDYVIAQTLEIGERQLDVAGLGPGAGGWNRCFCHFRQGANGGAREINRREGERRHHENKKKKGQPFSFRDHEQLAQREIRKQSDQ